MGWFVRWEYIDWGWAFGNGRWEWGVWDLDGGGLVGVVMGYHSGVWFWGCSRLEVFFVDGRLGSGNCPREVW